MQLKTLLADLPDVQIDGSLETEISGIAYDSRRVKPGFLFVAMTGAQVDGHAFVESAIDRGAVAVIGQEDARGHRKNVTFVRARDSRAALSRVSEVFYGHPSSHLKIAGVTGTNGKTTTAFLLKQIFEKSQWRCGLIGTVRYEIGERILPATRTTPEALDVQELLYAMRSAGCKAAVMEVSSHALAQNRVSGVEFDAAIFTNLSQDHLDYHGTMENYFAAKMALFDKLSTQTKNAKAVINIDDHYGTILADKFANQIPLVTYGMSMRADFRGSNLKTDFRGTSYQLDAKHKSYLVRLPLIGRFNVYNSLAAIAAASALGIDVRAAVLSLAAVSPVPGRLEAVPAGRQFRIFVDYAHTDDALINVMKTVRELSPARLIVVFGCGGNRDRSKRSLMGAAVERYADRAIITSDNPRKEDPEAIIEDIKKGFVRDSYETVVDRKEAIFRAISIAQPRDIVLIAGKGHETYQEFADRTVPFNDVEVAKLAVECTPVAVEN